MGVIPIENSLFQTHYEYDVFISYHNSDEQIAQELYDFIKTLKINSRNLSIFYAPIDLKPGYNFIFLLNEALLKARFYLLLLSDNYLQAEWPIAEQSAAIYNDPSGKLGRVIPIIVKPCRMPPLLQYRTYINLFKKDKKEIEKRKLASILTNEPLVVTYPDKDVISPIKKLVGLSSRSYEPDYLMEIIYSNLLPLCNLPEDIWSAPTPYNDKYEIKKKHKGNDILPAYILKNNRLYSFLDLSNEKNFFSKVTNQYNISYESVIDWIENEERKRWLIELLNDAIRSHAEEYRLTQDSISKKYFFKKGILRKRKISFKPHLKKAPRSLIIDVIRENRIIRVRHRSVKLNFIQLSNSLYLKIDPGIIFTYDGRNVIGDRERQKILCTKYLSRQKNEAVFSEFRFWAWLLSDDGKKIRINLGDRFLEIDVNPVSCNIERGIFGDIHAIPIELEAPPQLFEPEEFDELELLDDEDYFSEEIE